MQHNQPSFSFQNRKEDIVGQLKLIESNLLQELTHSDLQDKSMIAAFKAYVDGEFYPFLDPTEQAIDEQIAILTQSASDNTNNMLVQYQQFRSVKKEVLAVLSLTQAETILDQKKQDVEQAFNKIRMDVNALQREFVGKEKEVQKKAQPTKLSKQLSQLCPDLSDLSRSSYELRNQKDKLNREIEQHNNKLDEIIKTVNDMTVGNSFQAIDAQIENLKVLALEVDVFGLTSVDLIRRQEEFKAQSAPDSNQKMIEKGIRDKIEKWFADQEAVLIRLQDQLEQQLAEQADDKLASLNISAIEGTEELKKELDQLMKEAAEAKKEKIRSLITQLSDSKDKDLNSVEKEKEKILSNGNVITAIAEDFLSAKHWSTTMHDTLLPDQIKQLEEAIQLPVAEVVDSAGISKKIKSKIEELEKLENEIKVGSIFTALDKKEPCKVHKDLQDKFRDEVTAQFVTSGLNTVDEQAKKIYGNTKLRYQELSTILTECEKYDKYLQSKDGYEAAKKSGDIHTDAAASKKVTLTDKIRVTEEIKQAIIAPEMKTSFQIASKLNKEVKQNENTKTILSAHRDDAGNRLLHVITAGISKLLQVFGLWKPKSQNLLKTVDKELSSLGPSLGMA